MLKQILRGLVARTQGSSALMPLAGLCPLLAGSESVVVGLGLGLATLLVVLGSAGLRALLPCPFTHRAEPLLMLVVIAALTAAVTLLMHALFYQLHQQIGIFLPLIAVNSLLVLGVDEIRVKTHRLARLGRAVRYGMGFLAALVLFGSIRELVGRGTLLADMDWLFTRSARSWQLGPGSYQGWPLMLSPPGAFLCLGLLLATGNGLVEALSKRLAAPLSEQTPAKRARVTGNLR